VNATAAAATQIAIGAGNPGIASANPALIAVLNVVFTLALAPLFGLWGVATGTFLALTLGTVLFHVRFLKRFSLPVRDLLAGTMPSGVLAMGLAFPPALLAFFVGTPGGRLPAALWLAVSATIYGVPYWLIATRRGFLPERLEFPPGRRAVSPEAPTRMAREGP
jgi:O-antigen/teichoic acid export membrane protein